MQHEKPHPVSELSPELLRGFVAAFLNRGDCYPLQLDKGSYVRIKQPLTRDMVIAHLKGVVTIGAYALNHESYAKWLCLDADSDKDFATLIRLASKLDADSIPSYLERSRRGGHLWLFTPAFPGQAMRRFGKQLLAEVNASDTIELYPKQDQLVRGPGSLVRLPFGVHRKTGRRYPFITPDRQPLAPTIRQQIALLAHPQQVPAAFIDKVLSDAPEVPLPSPIPQFQFVKPGSGETLSEVLKAMVSVEQFVGQFVALDTQGRGHCPFHDDQHSSFQVNTSGNYWHCYAGCGGGSIIDFWMKWREHRGQDASFTATIKALRDMLLG